MNDWVSLGLGSVTGALVSEGLKVLIAEIEMVRAFKPSFKILQSTLKKVLQIMEEITSLQQQLEIGVKEFDELMDTINRARSLALVCSKVRWFSFLNRAKRAKEITEVNKEMRKFCQIDLPLLQTRNQLQSMKDNKANFEIVSKDNKANFEIVSANFKILNDKIDGSTGSPLDYKYLCPVPELDFVPVGLDWPLVELKKRLLDPAVVSLLVTAPPGCGKTTLVTHLCNDKDIKGEFKHIFFIVVSSSPNFRGIVKELLQHNGEAACTFENDLQAKEGLRKLLKRLTETPPVLLVLDDVWHVDDEISFLENFKLELPGYKILVTSRSGISILSSTYNLETLKDEDARKLLIKWAPQPNHASQAKYEDLLQKILRRCSGFPIVIKVLGASLKGKDLYAWEAQVESWSGRILDYNDVKVLLQPSFDALKKHLQNCFMDMGSFVEDQKIRASVVIDIWVELYSECRSSLFMSSLFDLASHNLLKLIPLGGNEQEVGFYNEFLVTQHDILRELAICQSKSKANLERERLNLEIRGDNIPDWCLDPMHTINARLLSISTLTTDDLFSSNQVEMKCPKVEALILNLSSSTYALPNCIATMEKLKVVVIINHGPNPAKLTNLSCLNSSPNLRRIRLEKVSVTWVDILQLKLRRLRKLSFVMCSFGKVSHDTKEDVSLALPSLQEVDMDYCYDLVELPFWFSEVVSLKILSITNCNKLTKLLEAISNLSKLEVLRLKSCINLSELPETIERLSNLQSLNISDCLGLEKLPLEIGNLQKLKEIRMRKCGKCELPESVKKLEDLEVICDEESAFLWERLKSKMKNLTVRVVEPEHNLNLFNMF